MAIPDFLPLAVRMKFSVSRTFSLLIMSFACSANICLGGEAVKLDNEALLAVNGSQLHAYTRIVESKDSDEIRLKKFIDFAKHNSGKYLAGQAELKVMDYYFKDKKWNDLIEAERTFFAKYPSYISLHGRAVQYLARMLADKKISDETRKSAFDVLLPNLKQEAMALGYTRGYIAGLRIPADEKYELAKKAAFTCGAFSGSADYLMGFLSEYALTRKTDILKENDPVKECEEFISFFGKDSIKYADAKRLLLRLKSTKGDTKAGDELAEFNKSEKTDKDAVEKIIAELIDLVAKEKYQDALVLIGKLREHQQYIVDLSIDKFINSQFAKLPSDIKVAFAEELFSLLPEGKNSAGLYNMLLQDKDILTVAGPENVLKAASCYFEKNNNDYFKDFLGVTLLTGGIERFSDNPQVRINAYTFASSALGKMGMSDLQAEYLFRKAKYEWDTDKAAAIESLRKAIAASPDTATSAKAGWFLDILEGRGKIVQGPLARKFLDFDDVSLDLPFSFGRNMDHASSVSSVNNVYSLKKNDVKQNIVSQEGITASSGKSSAVFAADGKDDTVWIPEVLPAAIIIPIQKAATVNKIMIKSNGQTRFTVSLLNNDGKVLSKYERAWPFLGCLNSETYWPGEDVTMNILPVDNVSFVKLELFDRIELDGGIKELKVFPSAYSAKTSLLLEPVKIDNAQKLLSVSWKADEPAKEIVYQADMESVRGYPMMRWFKPWTKRNPLNMSLMTGNIGVEFYGDNAELELANLGGADWAIDGESNGKIDIETFSSDQKKPLPQKYMLNDKLQNDRHLLQLKSRALPAANDKFGQNNIHFSSLKVAGKAKAALAIRFGNADNWTAWYALKDSSGSKIDIPANLDNKAFYQLGVFFDTRSVLAAESPKVENIVVAASDTPVKLAPETYSDKEKSLIQEDMSGVANCIMQRQAVVAYSKAGTTAEYEAAKHIADKAGLYLVPDDIGLNNYPGPVLAVGTPLTNLYCRQLLARNSVWSDSEFLNNPNGYIGTATDAEKKADFYYVTADTPSGVVNAAERLLKAVPQYKKPKEAFRVFNASTLEMIYPWQFHADRPSPEKCVLEMGQNDRRSVQTGIMFNKTLSDIKIECGNLVSSDGSVIPPPEIRYVAFYEWVPFFGDLRLPDILTHKPVLPIPENTSTGIWMTFKTQENSKPGDYKGVVIISADGYEKRMPVELKVLPVKIPQANRIDTLSYAIVPYWYHNGTKEYDKAFRSLCENEAEHSVSMIGLEPDISCEMKAGDDGKKNIVFNFAGIIKQMDVADEVYRTKNLPLPTFYCYAPRNLRALTARFAETENGDGKIQRIFAEQLTSYLKDSKRFDRFYLKVGDEPSDIEKWVEIAKPFKDGGIKVTTAHSTMYKNIEVAYGIMDAWCPNYQHDVFISFLKERKKVGDKLWWYCCGVPTTRITGKPVDNLPFYWLTAKWGFEGAHSYAALEAKESGSEGNDVPFRYDHGMSFRMVFLPDGSLLDSTRRELESEGIKDCLLIYSIKDAIAKLEKEGAKDTAAYTEKLNGILESVVPYKYGYAQMPAEWEKARASLYSLAEDVRVK